MGKVGHVAGVVRLFLPWYNATDSSPRINVICATHELANGVSVEQVGGENFFYWLIYNQLDFQPYADKSRIDKRSHKLFGKRNSLISRDSSRFSRRFN